MTLYSITGEYLELLKMMQDPDVDAEVVADTMEGIKGEFVDKAESYVIIDKELEADEKKLTAEIERLKKIADGISANRKKLKETLLSSMMATGLTSLPTEHFRLAVHKNGGVQPMWVESDVSKIPDEYVIREPKADSKKIREALKNGTDLPFAHFEERGVHLSIK